MKLVVIKRDGCRVPTEMQRIKEAVMGAAKSINDMEMSEVYAMSVAEAALAQFQHAEEVEIHAIKDAVENQLMVGPHQAVARAYIEYRHDRDTAREKKSRLNNEIRGLIEQSNASLLNENANKDSKVIPTQRDLLAGIVAKQLCDSTFIAARYRKSI